VRVTDGAQCPHGQAKGIGADAHRRDLLDAHEVAIAVDDLAAADQAGAKGVLVIGAFLGISLEEVATVAKRPLRAAAVFGVALYHVQDGWARDAPAVFARHLEIANATAPEQIQTYELDHGAFVFLAVGVAQVLGHVLRRPWEPCVHAERKEIKDYPLLQGCSPRLGEAGVSFASLLPCIS
jgi:hypothetical protein